MFGGCCIPERYGGAHCPGTTVIPCSLVLAVDNFKGFLMRSKIIYYYRWKVTDYSSVNVFDGK